MLRRPGNQPRGTQVSSLSKVCRSENDKWQVHRPQGQAGWLQGCLGTRPHLCSPWATDQWPSILTCSLYNPVSIQYRMICSPREDEDATAPSSPSQGPGNVGPLLDQTHQWGGDFPAPCLQGGHWTMSCWWAWWPGCVGHWGFLEGS